MDFWSFVDRYGPEARPGLGPCWLWAGRTNTQTGYGVLYMGRTLVTAHRMSFFLSSGRWPEPMACHHCDVRRCVRPDHLYEGSARQNILDAYARNRREALDSRGANNGHAKLTENDVRAIRRDHASGMGQWPLARKYGMSRSSIQCIVTRKQWAHLEDT